MTGVMRKLFALLLICLLIGLTLLLMGSGDMHAIPSNAIFI